VWGLDFYGFGNSDNYPEMAISADAGEPLGLACQAAEQLLAAISFILKHDQSRSLSLISHSWGSMPAGLVAAEHPDLIAKWVAFAPIAQRTPTQAEDEPTGPAWRLISAADQWNRFVEDVPKEESSVLLPRHFEEWAELYLATDPESRLRTPPSVKVPSGPFVEIKRAWSGRLAYDPRLVVGPVAIIRGGWDSSVPDKDARWLFDSFTHSKSKRDIKIARGTHLMHLEETRFELWSESINFLLASCTGPNSIPQKAANPDASRTPLLETTPCQNN
jgi:pimeloyl-ACP methyl ester carboxylesterase